MIDNFNKEQWRDIDGYDGMYQVSDLGRVRSRKSGEWKVLRSGKGGNGYLTVQLWRNGQGKTIYVHRLVANAFIPNSDETKTLINHVDECKQNNRVSNLEYCTARYNQTYNDINLRRKNCKRRKLKELYDPNLTYQDNIELFKEQGIECCEQTVYRLRNDLCITRKPKQIE